MTDVFDDIKDLLVFNNEDDFYLLQILQRKKENPQLGSNSRVVKNYYINNLEYLEKRYDEIKDLCIHFNARAMLRLNKRSRRKVAFKALQNIANSMASEEYGFIDKAYSKACGNGHNDKLKKWILDIDKPYSEDWLMWVKEDILSIEPHGNKILKELPTKNGIHLITIPFNLQAFSNRFPEIEVHKDNPINLFIP